MNNTAYTHKITQCVEPVMLCRVSHQAFMVELTGGEVIDEYLVTGFPQGECPVNKLSWVSS